MPSIITSVVDTTQRATNTGTSVSASSVPFGTAFLGRVVVLAVGVNSSASITSATIGGVTADVHGSAGGMYIISAVVDTGTSGTFAAVLSVSDSLLISTVWSLQNANPVQSSSDSGNKNNFALTVPAGGCAVGMCFASSNSGWSRGTQDYVDGVIVSTVHEDSSAGGSLTYTWSSALVVAGAAFTPLVVAVDSRSSGQGTPNSTPVSTFSHGHTVGTGSNRALVYVVGINSSTVANPTGLTCVWDSGGANQAMTLLATVQNTGDTNHANGLGGSKMFIFGLRNPSSGTHNISVNWTNAQSICGGAISFTGVDQTSDVAAFPRSNTQVSSATINLSLTSAAGNWTVFGVETDGAPGAMGGGFTHFFDNSLLYTDDDNTDGYDSAGASTVTLSTTIPGGYGFGALGVDVAAGAALAGDVLMAQIWL